VEDGQYAELMAKKAALPKTKFGDTVALCKQT
jgi:hypothetical protein